MSPSSSLADGSVTVPSTRESTEQWGVAIAPLTTMRVGGPAHRLVTVTSTDDLVDAVREVDEAGEPLLVVGGGSNLVVADAGFEGTVVRVATRGIELESDDMCGGANVRVAAGESWDDFVALATASRWSGIEALSGIPGLVGASPIQNIGAYGQDVATSIAQVRVWDRVQGAVRTVFNAQCEFTYRDSRFKRSAVGSTSRYVVLEVLFQFRIADIAQPLGYADVARALDMQVGDRPPLAEVREAVLGLRRSKGMVLDEPDHDTWSCGSFFTNPVLSESGLAALCSRVSEVLGGDIVPPLYPTAEPGMVKTSAAWLIERAGFGKGHGAPGPATLSTKHTLAVTNRGSARAQDVVALAREVRDGVRDRFGVSLVNEPVLVGTAL